MAKKKTNRKAENAVYDMNVRTTREKLIMECRHMAKRLTNVVKCTNELREIAYMARESATVLCRHLHEHNLDK